MKISVKPASLHDPSPLPPKGDAPLRVAARIACVAAVVLVGMAFRESSIEAQDADDPVVEQPRLETIPTEIAGPPIKVEIIPTPPGVPAQQDSVPEEMSETEQPETPQIAASDASAKQPTPGQGTGDSDGSAAGAAQSVGPENYRDWPTPDLTLVITGNQHGYIEPCGCTGLDNQKGGVARRYTFLKQLRDDGWNVAPIDAGNQVRRFGRQAEIKFQRTAEALKQMQYDAVGFGPEDVRLGVGELISVAASESAEDALYVSANVVLLDPSLMPQHKVIDRGGIRVGMTSILDPESLEASLSDEMILEPMVAAAKKSLEAILAESPNFKVLTFFGTEKAAENLVRQVPGFDVVVVSGGYGEPTYQMQVIENSETKMIVTGNKAMYVGLVGLYKNSPAKYCRLPMTHEIPDAPEMRKLMADYQFQLRDLGLEALGLKPIPPPSGRMYVGSEACGKCHTTAFDIWENTPHAHATDSLVHPGERGDVPRHFDPECISCHVTGWNPQGFYPYVSGYLSLEGTPHLAAAGCEGCHGPGAEHAAAEEAGSTVSEAKRVQLRDGMRLLYEDAREKCMECHDLDNSPDFHIEDAFEDEYWPQVEHYGLD
ncbi:multiheme c-type cytochrome [Novipirellula artificiosorum]|uniref:Perchlorate reductase subunit gamma n=1 Tax=Novipirellula artificiosorum TaxID=2528016 RepID=A0A5C6DA53_9BACT|nr:multiheme c-type cytochrome [Novipirellula artificiosorum]TWU31719.1 Perchlorate reductase subunit gamma precursor [Novipirellula artificiosorum]